MDILNVEILKQFFCKNKVKLNRAIRNSLISVQETQVNNSRLILAFNYVFDELMVFSHSHDYI